MTQELDLRESRDKEKTMDTPPLQLDCEQYRPAIESWDVSEEQKQEFLQILWDIMSAMVDVGFEVDSISLALDDKINTYTDILK